MIKGQPHPAAELSKNMMADGLLSLLKSEKYSDITVTQLCQESLISRRTFYRNFKTIDDVLSYRLHNILEDFSSYMKCHEYADKKSFFLAYFSFWEKQSDVLKLIENNGLSPMFFTEYIKCLSTNPQLFIKSIPKDSTESEAACRLSYISGGLWSVLTYWIKHGCSEGAKELAGSICSI